MGPSPSQIRALVVEDNPMNQRVVMGMLRNLGCLVDLANDGVEGLEMATRGYAIIFMDCSMPRMDGFEASRRIRALPAPHSHTPVVALTAHATPADRLACMEAGMDLWLPKPISPEDLQRTIERFTGWKPGAGGVAEESVLDEAVVDQFLELAGDEDPAFVRDLIDEFRSGADALVDEARVVLGLRRPAELRAALLRLSTSAGTVGARRIVELCATAAESDDETLLERAPLWLDSLGQHVLRATVALGNRALSRVPAG